MFSSKENIGNASYPTQWALNPAAYQNMDSANVDWAALAQQWIAMKEAVAIVGADPKSDGAEAGEAPMEVENPDAMNSDSQNSLDQWNGEGNAWGDNNWNQWGWGWPGAESSDPKAANSTGIPSLMDGFVPPDASNIPGYSSGMVPAPTFQHGYWTAQQPEQTSSAGRSSSKGSRTSSRNRDKSSRSRSTRDKAPAPPLIGPVTIPEMPTLDAAKRRQLPAWIREGLEKMEREKQRAIEREQEKKAREEAEKEKKRLEEEELERLKAEAGGVPMLPAKSKFDSDSDDESGDKKPASDRRQRDISPERVRTRDAAPREQPLPPPPPPPLVKKTKEEIMQEVMLSVRRSLTEILLEVTDQDINTVCQEELSRYNLAQASRLNAMRASKSKALSSIGSGLGLGAYESSSSGSDDDEEIHDVSDHQLQEIIKLRTSTFEKVSREIEAEVRRAEQREMEDMQETSPERDTQGSSATPPNSHSQTIESDTPQKITEHRHSRDQRNNHKSHDKPDGVRRTVSISEDTPKKTKNDIDNDKKDSSSSSEDSDSSSSSSSSSSQAKKRSRKSSSDTESRKKYREVKKDKVEEKSRYKSSRYEDTEKEYSKSKKRDDYDHRESRSRDSKKKDYYYEKSHKQSRDVERSHKDKYREDSGDERRRKRSKKSRSGSYVSARRDSRSRDRSEDRHRRRDYDKYDRYERSRQERRRTRSRSRHRR